MPEEFIKIYTYIKSLSFEANPSYFQIIWYLRKINAGLKVTDIWEWETKMLTDENLQNLSNLIGDKTSLPAPTDTIVNNIASVDAKADAIIDDNEAGLAKTFSSDKITKTFEIKEKKATILHFV